MRTYYRNKRITALEVSTLLEILREERLYSTICPRCGRFQPFLRFYRSRIGNYGGATGFKRFQPFLRFYPLMMRPYLASFNYWPVSTLLEILPQCEKCKVVMAKYDVSTLLEILREVLEAVRRQDGATRFQPFLRFYLGH